MKDDFSSLRNMIYSGRGVLVGKTPDGKPFIGYSLTGRSPSSQARKLEHDTLMEMINIKVTDEEQLKKGNPALLIYSAMVFINTNNMMIAGNGKQTSLLMQRAYNSERICSTVNVLLDAHSKPEFELDDKGNKIDITSYEPDAPNYTPRISGCIDDLFGVLYMVKKSIKDNKPDTEIFSYMLNPGQARMITTYSGGNESPLASFSGRPLEITVASTTAKDICENLYDAIGPKDGNNFRVSAAVMMMKNVPSSKKKEVDVEIINRFDRGI